MNWRLNEGRGECVYMLGYEDDGKATGMSPSELRASIKTLRVMMEAVGAKIADMQVGVGVHRWWVVLVWYVVGAGCCVGSLCCVGFGVGVAVAVGGRVDVGGYVGVHEDAESWWKPSE